MGSRRYAAVLFTDIQGYSRMMGKDESGTLDRLKRHNEIALPIIAANGGRLIKTIGDALMCEFPQPAQAVRAGLDLVAAMEREAPHQSGDRLRIRVGIHAGDVVDEGSDLFGETVNIAARLEPLAEPNALAVSHAVMRAVGEVQCRATDCGERNLKNISSSVHVYRLAPSGAARDPAPLPRPSRRRALVASLSVLLLAGGAGAAWLARPVQATRVRRLAVVATGDGAAGVDATMAWALASRLVEEIDHYKEFRPVSPAGVLAAREEMLGARVIPDEMKAAALAKRLQADTVAALAIAASAGGDLTVSVHVFSTADPASGVSAQRDHLDRRDLDGDGPARLAVRLTQALSRQWNVAHLTDEAGGVQQRTVPFDAFSAYLEATEYLNSGRYDLSETLLKHALEGDPENALFHSLLGCAYSFQGKDAPAEQEIKRAIAGLPQLSSRRERSFVLHDKYYIEADAAKRRGEKHPPAAPLALEAALELARVYHEPVGFLYAAIDQQYLLGDVPAARNLYAEARRVAPSAYPSYYEDAKLMRGDGKSPAGQAEAARLIWTFITCNPSSPMLKYARADADTWSLPPPTRPPECAKP